MIASAEQLDSLVSALEVSSLGNGCYRGPTSARTLPRLFGGHVLAQAIMAAGHAVGPDRYLHSLHTLFLRGGRPDLPVTYRVDALRDGRSFSARAVTAEQNGAVLATLQLSFTTEQTGPEHDCADPHPVPAPDDLPPLAQRLRSEADDLPSWWADPHPFDLRFVDHPEALAAGGVREPQQSYWVRASHRLPDEPLLHTALLAYVSDLTLLDPALMPHGRSWYGNRAIAGASIDHAMWFHRPTTLNDWLLCRQASPIAAAGRTLCTCTYTTAAGQRVASATQEGLLREP